MAEPAPFSNVPTTNDIASKRKLAQALMGQAIDTSPVGHWTQALARVVQGGVGGMNQNAAETGEKARQGAIVQALSSSPEFAGLSEPSRGLMAQNPEMMQAVAGKVIGNRLDPNAGLQRQLLEAKVKNLQAGGEAPSNVREWQHFQKMAPEDQQRYLTMKRAQQWKDTGNEFTLPNAVNPTQGPVATITKNNAAAEIAKGEGKTVAKVRDELPDKKLRLNLVSGGLSRLSQSVEDLQKQPGLNTVVGGLYQAYAPNISEKALNAQTNLENLKVQVSGNVLQAMKDASKTGGAVGQVTEREWPRLENMIANLDPKQGKEQFAKNLRDIAAYGKEVEAALREAYQADLTVAQTGKVGPTGGLANPEPQKRMRYNPQTGELE